MSSPKSAADKYEDFLVSCLGSKVGDTDANQKRILGVQGDIYAIKESEEDSASEEGNRKEAERFALDDGDHFSDSDEEWDVEDAYNFDSEKVAELLRKCDSFENREEIVEELQESMAEAMMLRLNVVEDAEQEAQRPDCSGDVTGLMTPPAKPLDMDASSPVEPKALAEKLQEEKEKASKRRSSIGGRRNLDLAVRGATARARKSIASCAAAKLCTAEDKAQIELAAESTAKRHRLSLCKAKETLELAGIGDEDAETVKARLKTLHECLLEARSRHRYSVARVVKQTIMGDEEEKETVEKSVQEDGEKPKVQSKLSASAKEFKPSKTQALIEWKIKQAVLAAKKRNGPVEAPKKSEVKPEWTTASEQVWHPGYDQSYMGYDQYSPCYSWDQYGSCSQQCYNGMGCGQYGQGCHQGCYQGCQGQGCYQGCQGGCYQGCQGQGCYQGCQGQGCYQGCQGQGCYQGCQGQGCWQGQDGSWMGQDGYNYGPGYGGNCGNYGNDYNCYNGYGQQTGYGGQQAGYGGWGNAAWGSA